MRQVLKPSTVRELNERWAAATIAETSSIRGCSASGCRGSAVDAVTAPSSAMPTLRWAKANGSSLRAFTNVGAAGPAYAVRPSAPAADFPPFQVADLVRFLHVANVTASRQRCGRALEYNARREDAQGDVAQVKEASTLAPRPQRTSGPAVGERPRPAKPRPAWWAPSGFAGIPTAALDPSPTTASPAVPAFSGPGPHTSSPAAMSRRVAPSSSFPRWPRTRRETQAGGS